MPPSSAAASGNVEAGHQSASTQPSSQPSSPAGRIHRMGSSSVLEFLGAVSHFQHNVQRYRWYVLSISTIKFLSILNITYTLVGMVFVMLAFFPPSNPLFHQILFYKIGIAILFFSPLALCADLLALKGLRQYRRVLLLPWLIFYAVILALAFSIFLKQIFHHGPQWHLLLLFFVALMMFTRWRHINLQFKLMSIYPERPTEQSLSEFAAAVHQSATATAQGPSGSSASMLYGKPAPPPKYEDLEQPPKYEDLGPEASGAAPGSHTALSVESETAANTLPATAANTAQVRSDCQNGNAANK